MIVVSLRAAKEIVEEFGREHLSERRQYVHQFVRLCQALSDGALSDRTARFGRTTRNAPVLDAYSSVRWAELPVRFTSGRHFEVVDERFKTRRPPQSKKPASSGGRNRSRGRNKRVAR